MVIRREDNETPVFYAARIRRRLEKMMFAAGLKSSEEGKLIEQSK